MNKYSVSDLGDDKMHLEKITLLSEKYPTKDHYPFDQAIFQTTASIAFDTPVTFFVGENGAGKSTLIKILTGAYDRTSGTTLLNGEEYTPHNPKEARDLGVSTLYQELNVVDELTVEENLTLGMEDTKFGFLRKTDKINRMISVMNSIEP